MNLRRVAVFEIHRVPEPALTWQEVLFKKKAQLLNNVQKQSRVKSCDVLKRKLGVRPSASNYKLHNLLNTDFPAPIKISRPRNCKNDWLWMNSNDSCIHVN